MDSPFKRIFIINIFVLSIIVLAAIYFYIKGSNMVFFATLPGLAYIYFAIRHVKGMQDELANPKILSGLIPVEWLKQHVEVVRSLIPDTFTDANDIDYKYIINRINDISKIGLNTEDAIQFVTILSHTGLYEQRRETQANGDYKILFRSTDIPAKEMDMTLRAGPGE